MIRLLPAFAWALAALLATGLSAQNAPRRCPDGEADDDGIQIDVSVAAHPTRVARTLDSLLVTSGYAIRDAPQATGRWSIAPRFTWLDDFADTGIPRGEHPGVLLFVESAMEGDSVRVEVGARVLCKSGSDETTVGMLSAATLVTGLTMSLDTLRKRGVDLSEPAPRAVTSLQVPETVGDFRLTGREDFENPRLGSSFRYGREEDGMYFDVYIYPGPSADSSCPRSCAEGRVDQEAEGFVGSLEELIRRGYYRRMDVTRDERLPVPDGAAFRAGRQVVMEVVRSEGSAAPAESQFILYSFPGYMVKVRATYAPSTKMEGTVRTFVSDLLDALAGKTPAPSNQESQ